MPMHADAADHTLWFLRRCHRARGTSSVSSLLFWIACSTIRMKAVDRILLLLRIGCYLEIASPVVTASAAILCFALCIGFKIWLRSQSPPGLCSSFAIYCSSENPEQCPARASLTKCEVGLQTDNASSLRKSAG